MQIQMMEHAGFLLIAFGGACIVRALDDASTPIGRYASIDDAKAAIAVLNTRRA